MIQGHCNDRFAEVRQEFERNFTERGEVGASVAITLAGETVVDLWGGIADPATGAPWERDTMCVVWSTTKGAAALSAHVLSNTGDLDFDRPVADYWPEFAANGKDGVLVRHLLTHQAGVPGVREPLPPGAFYDWDLMTSRLAAEAPFWEPGTRHGYHALTFGFLIGEVVRRITGTTIGTFFRKEVAEPLGLDFWIGLPSAEEGRVARLLEAAPPGPGDAVDECFILAMTDPTSLPALAIFNSGGYMLPGEADSRAAHQAELPSSGGITNARGVAGMYGQLAHGGLVGSHQFSRAEIYRMTECLSAGSRDAVLLTCARWGMGFMKGARSAANVVPRQEVVLSPEAFGHVGSGGSIGFVDPRAGMSFGFVMNQMKATMGIPNAQPLIDAAYRALGYETNRYGFWV